MRCLARELDIGPASLYVHVRNTTELNALLIDRHLAGLDLRWDDGESARECLHRTLDDYMRLLASRPALAQAALVTWPEGPHYFDLIELLLRALRGLGVDTATAGQAVDLLLQVASASTAEWAARASADAQTSPTSSPHSPRQTRSVTRCWSRRGRLPSSPDRRRSAPRGCSTSSSTAFSTPRDPICREQRPDVRAGA